MIFNYNYNPFSSLGLVIPKTSLPRGEPSGTAGQPILAAIDSGGIRGAVVVVTRYFGGTKLGTGGLAWPMVKRPPER